MSRNTNEKKRLLESLEYIDEGMLSDTLSRVKTDVGKPSAVKRPIVWIKQVAVIAACALLLGAVIPVVNYVSNNPGFGGFGAGDQPEATETEPPIETTATIEETDPIPEETEFVPDEHGTPGLRYMINEDGATASFIGWGDCQDETVYIASVYEGLPVTKIVFYELWEQQKRLKELLLTNPDYVEQTIAPDDFTFPNIKHVVIPDSVEYVEAGVINQCDHIESLHIGAGVNDIEGGIFFNGERGKNFNCITVSPENQYYTEKGNCLIRIKDKVLLCGFANSVIPDDGSVEIIGTVAFFNKPGLKSVVVPEGVVRIMNGAFLDNDELVSVSLPSTIKTLFVSFGDNPVLTEFKFAGSVKQWTNMSKNWANWISDTSLTKVICSDGEVELKFDNRGNLVD